MTSAVSPTASPRIVFAVPRTTKATSTMNSRPALVTAALCLIPNSMAGVGRWL